MNVIIKCSIIIITLQQGIEQMILFIWIFLLVTSTCLEVKTIVGLSATVPVQFPSMNIFQIQTHLINSTRNGTQNVCWPNRRFLNYQQEGEKFMMNKLSSSLKYQSTEGQIKSKQQILNFIVSEDSSMYIITTKGRVLYSQDKQGKVNYKNEQLDIQKQLSNNIIQNQYKVLPLTKYALIYTSNTIYLLKQNKIIRLQNNLFKSNIVQIRQLTNDDNNNSIQLLVLVDNSIKLIAIDLLTNQVISSQILSFLQLIKSKQQLKSILDFQNKYDVYQNNHLLIVDKQKGVFEIKYNKISSTEPEQCKNILNIKDCHKLDIFNTQYLIATCKSINISNSQSHSDYIVELYMNQTTKTYQKRIQQNQQQTQVTSVNILQNYYVISKPQIIQFYFKINKYNQQQTQHISINQIPSDPITHTQLLVKGNGQFYYYSTNQTIYKIKFVQSVASIYCFSYISIQQSFKVIYKGICQDGNVCQQQSVVSFKSIEYKYICVLIDLVGILAGVGIYFYHRKKNTILQSAQRSFEMMEISQNSDESERQL